MVNENKICFLICVNDNLFFEECVRYIQWLEVPDGVDVEILEIREAGSMASGYNEGMNSIRFTCIRTYLLSIGILFMISFPYLRPTWILE